LKYILLGLLIYTGFQEQQQPQPAQLPVVTDDKKPPLAPSGPPVGNYKEITDQVAANSEAQKVRDKMTAPELIAAYQKFLTELIPDYNYIQVKAGRHHYHQCLVALHPFFNKYAFSVGPLARQVGQWLMDHRTALKAHKIKEIGVAAYWHISPENAAFFEVP